MGATLTIGVLAITLTEATGQGARRGVEKTFRSMLGAFDVLLIQPGGPAMRGMAQPGSSVATLTRDDIRAIVSQVPNIQDASMAQTGFRTGIDVAGKNGTTTVFGVTPNWFSLRGDAFSGGAPFTSSDDSASARVAVIGSDIARDYYAGVDAVGQRLRVGGIDFQVVGVLSPHGAGPGGASLDNVVDLPLQTTIRRVFNRQSIELGMVKLERADEWARTQTAVTTLLRDRHGIRPPMIDDFQVISPEALITRYATVDSALRRAFFWVGFLALMIGGVVVANLMFTAASTRRQEIGARRAVGATRVDILAQFWVEAVVVVSVAGILGAIVGVLLTQAGARMMRIPLAISWTVTLGAMAVTFGIGVLAGYFPARRAASENPGAALRTPT
ncbi:MAG: ABC transporter permease [Gemmatimonadota bacterium]|nr:ABC transporter permease [Gemmatimonadota bacterium]